MTAGAATTIARAAAASSEAVARRSLLARPTGAVTSPGRTAAATAETRTAATAAMTAEIAATTAATGAGGRALLELQAARAVPEPMAGRPRLVLQRLSGFATVGCPHARLAIGPAAVDAIFLCALPSF